MWEVYFMTKRKCNILLACTALALGGFLYICFRSGTYIAVLVDSIIPIGHLQTAMLPLACPLLSYYIPDFLWAFSLCCMLIAVNTNNLQSVLLCAGFTLFFGIMWELLQHLHILSGTGDIWDVFIYLLAAVLSAIINLGGNKP